MKTTKVNLFAAYQQHETMSMHVWDRWFDWRLKQAGIDRDDEKAWYNLLHSMPNIMNWHPSVRNNVMHFSWEGGEEDVPLEVFFDDAEDQPDLDMLWHSNYWDGPLSGMARYNGEEVWFNCISEEENGDRIFGLYRLSKEDHAELTYRHELFRDMVGHHCDHDPERYSDYKCTDQKKFDDFYDLKSPNIDATKGEKLACVHWFQFRQWTVPR